MDTPGSSACIQEVPSVLPLNVLLLSLSPCEDLLPAAQDLVARVRQRVHNGSIVANRVQRKTLKPPQVTLHVLICHRSTESISASQSAHAVTLRSIPGANIQILYVAYHAHRVCHDVLFRALNTGELGRIAPTLSQVAFLLPRTALKSAAARCCSSPKQDCCSIGSAHQDSHALLNAFVNVISLTLCSHLSLMKASRFPYQPLRGRPTLNMYLALRKSQYVSSSVPHGSSGQTSEEARVAEAIEIVQRVSTVLNDNATEYLGALATTDPRKPCAQAQPFSNESPWKAACASGKIRPATATASLPAPKGGFVWTGLVEETQAAQTDTWDFPPTVKGSEAAEKPVTPEVLRTAPDGESFSLVSRLECGIVVRLSDPLSSSYGVSRTGCSQSSRSEESKANEGRVTYESPVQGTSAHLSTPVNPASASPPTLPRLLQLGKAKVPEGWAKKPKRGDSSHPQRPRTAPSLQSRQTLMRGVSKSRIQEELFPVQGMPISSMSNRHKGDGFSMAEAQAASQPARAKRSEVARGNMIVPPQPWMDTRKPEAQGARVRSKPHYLPQQVYRHDECVRRWTQSEHLMSSTEKSEVENPCLQKQDPSHSNCPLAHECGRIRSKLYLMIKHRCQALPRFLTPFGSTKEKENRGRPCQWSLALNPAQASRGVSVGRGTSKINSTPEAPDSPSEDGSLFRFTRYSAPLSYHLGHVPTELFPMPPQTPNHQEWKRTSACQLSHGVADKSTLECDRRNLAKGGRVFPEGRPVRMSEGTRRNAHLALFQEAQVQRRRSSASEYCPAGSALNDDIQCTESYVVPPGSPYTTSSPHRESRDRKASRVYSGYNTLETAPCPGVADGSGPAHKPGWRSSGLPCAGPRTAPSANAPKAPFAVPPPSYEALRSGTADARLALSTAAPPSPQVEPAAADCVPLDPPGLFWKTPQTLDEAAVSLRLVVDETNRLDALPAFRRATSGEVDVLENLQELQNCGREAFERRRKKLREAPPFDLNGSFLPAEVLDRSYRQRPTCEQQACW